MGANKAFISLWALNRYDPHLFNEFHLPEDIDKETLVDNLLLETAELEVIYPDAVFMRIAIDKWSRKELPIWEKLLATTQYEYNPIWNKDGEVIETETRNLRNDETRNLQNNETRNLHKADNGSNSSHTEGSSDTDQDTTNTLKVAAYDSDDFENREETTNDNSVYVSDEADSSGSYNSTSDDTGTVRHDDTGTIRHDDTGTVEHKRIEKGNIGITTTQQMINEEREVVKLNMMNYIIDSFKNRFCILIY